MDEHVQACRQIDGRFMCVYFPSGGRETIDFNGLKTRDCHYWWLNPRDGKCYKDELTVAQEPAIISIINPVMEFVTPSTGSHQDWILVIDAADENYDRPGDAKDYGELAQAAGAKKVFNW